MKKPTLLLISVLILSSLVQVSYLINSFPGFHSDSDCALCHNEPVSAYNSSYADSTITLDGQENEVFWQNAFYRSMEIPVGNYRGAEEQFISVTFAQNSTHLFMYISWSDVQVDGKDSARFGGNDGFAVMWNTNNSQRINEDYFAGMKTSSPDEVVDTWVVKTAANGETQAAAVDIAGGQTGSIDTVILDTNFDDGGWNDAGDTAQNVYAAEIWGNMSSHATHNYGLEIARPLVTNDPGDVQFDQIGYYEFAIAIYNGTSGEDHLISFVHQVFVYGECDTDCVQPVVVTEYYPEVTTEVSVETSVSTSTKNAPISFMPILFGLMAVTLTVAVYRKKFR